MSNTYHSPRIEEVELYQSLLSTSSITASDYTFGNIWGWAPFYSLQWRFTEELCWIRQSFGKQDVYWAPVGNWTAITDWSAYAETAAGTTCIRVPEPLALLWQEQFDAKIHCEEARGQWDYLYSSAELSTLSGNRFHKKKNLVRQFQKLYEYEYSPLSARCAATVLSMQHEWCRWHDCEGSEALLAENDAVERVLRHWDDIPHLCGGIIRIDGTPVAYTLAEPLGADTLIVHFEKAASNIKGGYQAINYLFANDVTEHYSYLNREQDLDEAGLRQAKMSYNPVGFIKKYTVSFV